LTVSDPVRWIGSTEKETATGVPGGRRRGYTPWASALQYALRGAGVPPLQRNGGHKPRVLLCSFGDSAAEPVCQTERLIPRLRGERRRAEAVPVIQAEEAGGVTGKVRT